MTLDSGNSSLRAQTISREKHTQNLRQVLGIFKRRHFSPYKVLVNRQHRTVVILNPKVGTTCFRHIAARAYVEVLGFKDPSDGRYQSLKKANYFPFAAIGDYYHAFSHPQEYDFYCFVRNPYARVKSAWVNKFANGHDSGYPRSIQGKLLNDMRHFAGSHQLPGSEPDSLVPFVTFLAYIGAHQDGKRNHHWDVQHDVLMTDVIHYSQIYKMETQFNDGIVTILNRLGVPASWTRQAMEKPLNQSKKVRETVFTPELAEQTKRIYGRDFQIFGYDEDSWKGM
ncbi:MAG: sulfotransferase family 2 domain-containing protein [Abditibacteriaceae bacterium]